MPTHDEIAARARHIYDMAGRPEGKAIEHWLQAETQLIAERTERGTISTKASAAPINAPRAQPAGRR